VILPSEAAEIWESLGELETVDSNSYIHRAIQDLTDTIHAIARDLSMPDAMLLRLNVLTEIPRYRTTVLSAPKTAIDFFPVPVFEDPNRGIPADAQA
jgi:hypothetical protein